MSGNHAVFEKFIEHIQKASELQTLTTKFVENEEDELNFNSLTNRLKELNIKDNFPLYEIYLRFLSSFPFKRPKLNFIYTKIYQIIDYLIEEQEMKAKFHYTTIFNIFEYNKTLILYAYNKGLFDLEPIERKILTREDIDLLTFFIPEILEKDEDFFNTKLTQFYVNKKQ